MTKSELRELKEKELFNKVSPIDSETREKLAKEEFDKFMTNSNIPSYLKFFALLYAGQKMKG